MCYCMMFVLYINSITVDQGLYVVTCLSAMQFVSMASVGMG